MNARTLVLAGALFGCGGDGDLTKADLIDGKSDDASRDKLCREAGLEPGCDLCAHYGWYDDGVCDAFCLAPDPSCGFTTIDVAEPFWSQELHGSSGVIHFLDLEADLVRRFEIASGIFLAPLEGGSDVTTMAIAPDDGTVYLGHEDGRVSAFPPGSTAASPFAATAGRVEVLVVAGDRLFTVDDQDPHLTDVQGLWSLFARDSGALLKSYPAPFQFSGGARHFAYGAARDLVYFVGSDLEHLDLESGLLTERRASDTDTAELAPPVRLTPGETEVVLGSGLTFDPQGLQYRRNLGMALQDVAFLGDKTLVLRASAFVDFQPTRSELVRIGPNLEVIDRIALEGAPQGVIVGATHLGVVTLTSVPQVRITLIPR